MRPELAAALLAALLLGSIPTGYVVAKAARGVDIRTVGDGNVGARNVYWQVGAAAGAVVLAVDLAKGAGTIWAAQWLGLGRTGVMAAGLVAAVANDFSPWLRFQAGQGMAVTLGILAMVIPGETAIAVAAALGALAVTRHWDASWSVGLALLPVLAWIAGRPPELVLFPVVLLPLIGAKKLIDLPRARRARRGGAEGIEPSGRPRPSGA